MADIKYHGLPTEKLHDLIDELIAERAQLVEQVDDAKSLISKLWSKLDKRKSQLTTVKDNIEELKDSLISYLDADTGHRRRKLETIEDDEHPLKIIEMTTGYLKSELEGEKELSQNHSSSCIVTHGDKTITPESCLCGGESKLKDSAYYHSDPTTNGVEKRTQEVADVKT